MQYKCRVLALFGKAVRELGIQKRGGEKHRGLPKSSRVSEGQCSKMGGKHTGVTVGTCSRGGVGMLCMLTKTLMIWMRGGYGRRSKPKVETQRNNSAPAQTSLGPRSRGLLLINIGRRGNSIGVMSQCAS